MCVSLCITCVCVCHPIVRLVELCGWAATGGHTHLLIFMKSCLHKKNQSKRGKQSKYKQFVANSRLELAGACQLKVVITLRLSTQTHDTIHENQQTISLGRRLHAR